MFEWIVLFLQCYSKQFDLCIFSLFYLKIFACFLGCNKEVNIKWVFIIQTLHLTPSLLPLPYTSIPSGPTSMSSTGTSRSSSSRGAGSPSYPPGPPAPGLPTGLTPRALLKKQPLPVAVRLLNGPAPTRDPKRPLLLYKSYRSTKVGAILISLLSNLTLPLTI